MAIKIHRYQTREEWERARVRIGGSDAAAIVGESPYMTNADLWEIKTGRKKGADLSDVELVQYGHDAEPLLRELFKLDRPDLKVEYVENNLFTNDKYPFAHVSLDGWLIEKATGRKGVLEIKTALTQSAAAVNSWRDRIPQKYYIQVLHECALMEADFVIVLAQLKNATGTKVTRAYTFERAEIAEDMNFLMAEEAQFWNYVKTDTRPPLVLGI